MENNNNNNNLVNKKKTYSKLFWSISSVLFAGLVTVGGVFAYKLITDSNSNSSSSTVNKETLLFTSRDISNFVNKLENNNWTEEEFDNKAESQSLKTFAQENLLANNQPVKNLISNVYPMNPSNNKQGLEVELNKETTWQYQLSPDVDPQVATFANDSLYFRNLDISFIKGVQLTKLNDLYSSLNNYISNPTRKYTSAQFKLEVENEQKNSDIKALIADKIYVSETEKIPLSSIISVTFNGSQLLVKLDPFNSSGEMVKYLVESNPNMFFQNNILYVDNLKFWTEVSFSQSDLNNLNVNIQNYINQNANKYTINEFEQQLNNVVFKSNVARYLNTNIENIGDITYSNNTLTIKPQSMIKFSCSTTTNILTNNGIEINGLNFWSSTHFINLDFLYNAINNYILDPNKKFTSSEFIQDIQNYSSSIINDIISKNLYISQNETINPNKILSISLNTQNQLEITLDTTYNKYTLENSSNVFTRDNKLIVNNLDLYSGISISETNLNNIEKYVQDYINRDSNRLTEVEFANRISTYAFKNEIAKVLGTDQSNISEILFDGSILKILPKSKCKFITTRENDSLIDGNIIVKNFTFFNITKLTNLNFLYNAINNYIIDPSNKFTPSQFRLDIAANKSNIKNKVAQNLYLSTGSTINVSEILDVSLNDVDQFEITLSSNQKKYELEQNGNVALVGTNKLVVSDLNFYTEIVFENSTLNNLLANIQTFIDSKLSTRSEFIGQLSTNEFKQKVSEFLSVKIDTIGQMAYGDTYLEINPANRFKFSSRTASNLIVNDGIRLEGLKFYDEVNLVNLFKIYDSINNYIIDESRKLTSDEFKNELKSDTSEIRTTIADAINISSSGKIESSQITNLILNANNELEITLSSNYIRYAGQSTENVVLSNNKLVIKNLTFYTRIAISDSVLNTMRTNINDYIKDNSIQGSVESINSDELFNLIQTIKTEDNKNLGIYIDAPSLSSGIVTIPFKPLVKMDSKVLQDIEVTTNNILIKNLSMSPSDDYFIWDAKIPTKIVGLSDLGKKQTSIILPEKATEISDDAFMNNTNVISIDMSDTKITSIPDGWVETGTFSGCTNLETITLPDNLESIGLSAFHGCSKLSNIKSKQIVSSEGSESSNTSKTTTVVEKNGLPSKLKSIGNRSFRYCSSLSQIELSENLTSIGMGAFARSGLTSITIPNSITVIPQNAFQYCNSLIHVTLSNSIKSIDLQAFADCENLLEINIPDSIEKINTLAFQYSQKINIYVSSELMKTKLEGFNLALANGNNAIIVKASN